MDPISAGAQIFGTILNNEYAKKLTAQDRWENYTYGERAAHNADARTRALYHDFYSPQALIGQYQAAGLSPSMMFGGTPGQGGMSGAQGNGAAGPQTPYMPMSMLEAAQISNMQAQTKKTEAETKNIETDTAGKELANTFQNMTNEEKYQEWRIFQTHFTDEKTGEPKPIMDFAIECEDWDEFRTGCKALGLGSSEYEVNALKRIYLNSLYLDRDISIIAEAKTTAEFNKSVLEAIREYNNGEYFKENAESIISYLKKNVQTNKLEEAQKGAWNDLLERIGRKSKTAKDVILIIGMLMDKAFSEYRLPTIQPTTINKQVTYNQ